MSTLWIVTPYTDCFLCQIKEYPFESHRIRFSQEILDIMQFYWSTNLKFISISHFLKNYIQGKVAEKNSFPKIGLSGLKNGGVRLDLIKKPICVWESPALLTHFPLSLPVWARPHVTPFLVN